MAPAVAVADLLDCTTLLKLPERMTDRGESYCDSLVEFEGRTDFGGTHGARRIRLQDLRDQSGIDATLWLPPSTLCTFDCFWPRRFPRW
jgi:hypothetical protein